MLQYKEGICTCHGKPRLIVKKLPGRDLCVEGNRERLDARGTKRTSRTPILRNKPLNRGKGLTYKRKATGEGVMFESIWGTRDHRSFLDGAPLGNDAYAWYFAHILRKAKGFWPKFKLYDKNIILLTRKQHENYDLYVNKPEILLEMDARWQKVFDLREELLEEYSSSAFLS